MFCFWQINKCDTCFYIQFSRYAPIEIKSYISLPHFCIGLRTKVMSSLQKKKSFRHFIKIQYTLYPDYKYTITNILQFLEERICVFVTKSDVLILIYHCNPVWYTSIRNSSLWQKLNLLTSIFGIFFICRILLYTIAHIVNVLCPFQIAHHYAILLYNMYIFSLELLFCQYLNR